MLRREVATFVVNGKRSFEVYLKLFFRPCCSFSDEDALFIFLNTELSGEEACRIGITWWQREQTAVFSSW
jgi:hypothetical protein